MIGSKGHLIREIMEDCGGVQIRFPSENSNSDKVHVRGPKAEVEKAKKRLLDVANNRVRIYMSCFTIVLFSCPFEVGLCLCYVRFSSAISP